MLIRIPPPTGRQLGSALYHIEEITVAIQNRSATQTKNTRVGLGSTGGTDGHCGNQFVATLGRPTESLKIEPESTEVEGSIVSRFATLSVAQAADGATSASETGFATCSGSTSDAPWAPWSRFLIEVEIR